MDKKTVGLVLVSHGNYALEALCSSEMIMGRQEKAKAVSVMPGMDLEQVKREIEAAINEVRGMNGVIVMTDIIGGTPANAAGFFSVLREDIVVMTGFNMPMILEFFACRCESLKEIADKLGITAQQGIVNLTNSIREQHKKA